jgi:HK97 family phage major capsid protein
MDKKKLLDLISKKNERKATLAQQANACTDVAQLRAINNEMDSLNEEIRELQALADSIPDTPSADPDGRTAAVTGQIPGVVQAGATGQQTEQKSEDKYSTLEYRKAFMESVLRGTPIPAEYRDDTFSAIADAAAVIPTNIMNEIIKEMKVRGQIFRRCRLTNIPGGVRYPILSLKPVATRISEDTISNRQKIRMDTYVSFGYLILECRVATSLLASVVSLPMFEAQIVPLIVEAMTTTNEYEVFNGNGTTEMLGILNDTRVKAAQKITLSSSEFTEWDSWKKKVFSKVPLAYRSYEIFMGAGTFEGYIDGMVDANGQPIGRTNYGISDAPVYRFGGKNVVEVEEDVIKSYDNAEAGDVVAVFVDLGEYAINSNMQMAMYRWFDHDSNQWVDKAILINDGKLLDPAGVIIVKKGA